MMHRLLALVALQTLAGFSPDAESRADDQRLQQIETYVAEYVDMAAFDGVVLIAEQDSSVWEKGFGSASYENALPMTAETVFRIASLSKQVTKAAIGRLIDQNKLKLDSRLDEFLPEFPNARRITIRQLVEHSAGIAHTNRLDWMDMRKSMTLDAIVANLANERLLFEPGKGYQYSNGGYALLARVIEIASGTSYGDFIAAEFAARGYPSIGHEVAHVAVASMANRYSPGPVYGERVLADTYVTANRIGGGSLYANARDLLHFFRDTYSGALLSTATTAELFPLPEDGDVQITGRSPGALAQVYLDFDERLAVVTLSSNSAWPASFNTDIVSLYRGDEVSLTPFTLDHATLPDVEWMAVSGDFVADRFGWQVSIVRKDQQFVFVQDQIQTAFARTTDGEFYLPIYDWLCRYGDYGMDFECRQRDPNADIRFNFARR